MEWIDQEMTWEDFDTWLAERKLHKGKYLFKSSFGGQAWLDCVMDDFGKIITTDIDFMEDADSGEIEEAIRKIEKKINAKI